MRLLAFSDIHGNAEAVKKLVAEVANQAFDVIVFAGDFTNAWFDGVEEGAKQMAEIAALVESLDRPFYYVYGNRDESREDAAIVKCPVGKDIGKRDCPIDGYVLTTRTRGLDESRILVHHMLSDRLRFAQAEALLYLYGHDHVGRVYKNYIDLGFLHRGAEAHGARESLFGCYWFIEMSENHFQLENHSWQLKESRCPQHADQGVFYVPYYWKKDCTLCYDEEENRFRF